MGFMEYQELFNKGIRAKRYKTYEIQDPYDSNTKWIVLLVGNTYYTTKIIDGKSEGAIYKSNKLK